MVKVNFVRTGGFLGREIKSFMDLNEIPEDESQEIQRMILESNFFNIPQNLIEPSKHDEYEYTITIESGNSHHTVQTTDTSAPESLRPLLEKLSSLAKEGDSRFPAV
jgi:hypothetical protein